MNVRRSLSVNVSRGLLDMPTYDTVQKNRVFTVLHVPLAR